MGAYGELPRYTSTAQETTRHIVPVTYIESRIRANDSQTPYAYSALGS